MPVRVLEGEADCAASLRRAVVPDHNPVAGLAELVRPDHDDRPVCVRDQVDRRRPTSTVSVAPRPRLPTTVRSACRDSAARTGNGKPLVTAGSTGSPGSILPASSAASPQSGRRRHAGPAPARTAERYPDQRPDERMYDPQDRAARRGLRGGPADRGLCRSIRPHRRPHAVRAVPPLRPVTPGFPTAPSRRQGRRSPAGRRRTADSVPAAPAVAAPRTAQSKWRERRPPRPRNEGDRRWAQHRGPGRRRGEGSESLRVVDYAGAEAQRSGPTDAGPAVPRPPRRYAARRPTDHGGGRPPGRRRARPPPGWIRRHRDHCRA